MWDTTVGTTVAACTAEVGENIQSEGARPPTVVGEKDTTLDPIPGSGNPKQNIQNVQLFLRCVCVGCVVNTYAMPPCGGN